MQRVKVFENFFYLLPHLSHLKMSPFKKILGASNVNCYSPQLQMRALGSCLNKVGTELQAVLRVYTC